MRRNTNTNPINTAYSLVHDPPPNNPINTSYSFADEASSDNPINTYYPSLLADPREFGPDYQADSDMRIYNRESEYQRVNKLHLIKETDEF